jgi:hypothetical protein
MPDVVAQAACSQCGRALPIDRMEVASWKHADLVLTGELDETLLLCPECREEDRELAYDEGGAE